MSLREEDRQKNNCPSRGLGLAAAAIGVGVGAALYYFFNKRPENPDEEGSTSGWTCEQPHAFNLFSEEESDTSMANQYNSPNNSTSSEYTTISETTTTDTSVHDTESSVSSASSEQSEDDYIDVIPSTDEDLDVFNIEDFVLNSDSVEVDSDSQEWEDWDVTDSSLGLPEDTLFRELSPLRIAMNSIGALFSPRGARNNRSRVRTYEQEQMDTLRAQTLSEEEYEKFLKAQKFRERSWSLEECSICFEIMLKDQDLTKLPCAHNFHSSCLAPWLTEQQTCPNCRKAAE
ncbi:uncharacterized protein isoform X1 [Choristoneura fumiferana]|uniref:uncharacterized protein isoform X1 n=1 Tax=Choristoneura fumiferana TaxID=7141 RepID=UPI003D15A9A5